LATTGGSTIAARAWIDRASTDTEVSAAVFLDTIIPVEIVGRGTDLGGTAPTYYGVLATRGLEVQLVRVVRGTPTVLAKMKSVQYFTGKWARVVLHAKGKTLGVQVSRPDTKEYLTAEGHWQPQVAWAITATDTQIPGPGVPGLIRRAQYQGTVTFDDFAAGPPTGDPRRQPPSDRRCRRRPRCAASTIPRHYPHIRASWPTRAARWGRSRTSCSAGVDVVVSNPRHLEHINQVSRRRRSSSIPTSPVCTRS
jgi:hypothetical protein